MRAGAIERVKLNSALIRYSQCWEDSQLLLAGLTEAPSLKTVLSIAAAGDNTLSILSLGERVERVLAIDFSPAQLALLELKMGSFKCLNHEETLLFLGARGGPGDGPKRLALFEKLKQARVLSPSCLNYFDQREEVVAAGVIHCGKLEGYFRIFSRFLLPLLHRPDTIDGLLQERSEASRSVFYERKWNTPLYQLASRLFFSRAVAALLGRERSFFKEAEDSFSRFIAKAVETHLKSGAAEGNAYLCYILKGCYGKVLPNYLRPENYAVIASNLDKISLRQGGLQDVLSSLEEDSVDAFNLSDVFEYMSKEDCAAVAGELLRVGRKGARLIYWNMLVDRCLQELSNQRTATKMELTDALPGVCPTFFYKRFALETVL